MGIELSDWVENIVGKEKLLITSNFSFSNKLFKSCLLLMQYNTLLLYMYTYVQKQINM